MTIELSEVSITLTTLEAEPVRRWRASRCSKPEEPTPRRIIR